jgi:hypothetical protein
MKLLNKVTVAGLLLGLAMATQPMVASAQETIQSERAAHPEIVQALQQMQGALRAMQSAPNDFGGNKRVAIDDTVRAIHSLKKALYFRLKMDDAAIDRAP